MTFESYWAAVVEKYPHLGNPEARTAVRVSSLRDLMAQAHARGVEHGRLSERGAEMLRKKEKGNDDFEKMFRSIFQGGSRN